MDSNLALTKNEDFKAIATNNNCIDLLINSNIDLSNAKVKILGENRNLLIEINNPEYESNICIYTGKPMFIELHTQTGLSVHYVQGSGKDFYQVNN
jgi:predicted ribosome-associated RNA-binding protein Tma20